MLLAFLLQAVVNPGEVKTFVDWTVGCDNGRACQAVALLREPQLEGATLTVQRGADAGAAPNMWVTIRNEGVPSPAFLAIDGRRFALALDRASQELRVRDPLGAARLLGQATRIEALDDGGRRLASITTRGSAASLLYMDSEQRRIGTTSALVRRGSRIDMPPPPALPVVRTPPVPARGPKRIGVGEARRLIGPDAAVCDGAQVGLNNMQEARLDARHSLVLVNHACGNGAYNFFSTAYVIDERGRARLAPFEALPSMGMDDFADARLTNAEWDAATRRLDSFAKGRGPGDCGASQSYAWDGARFRLVAQAVMGECRGSTDYITTWRARVVPGRRWTDELRAVKAPSSALRLRPSGSRTALPRPSIRRSAPSRPRAVAGERRAGRICGCFRCGSSRQRPWRT